MFRRTLFCTAAAAFMTAAGALAPSGAAVPHFDHVYVIMMENQSFDNVLGRNKVDPNSGNILGPDTPFLTSLAVNNGLSTLYFGVTHPSLPNYLATIGGDYFGVQDDNPSCFARPAPGPGCHVISAPNLVDSLEAKGLTWTAYFQSMPSVGYYGTQFPGSAPRLYAQKHNPFMYFSDIASNSARLALLQPLNKLSVLSSALANPSTAPNFVYIVPDQCRDMHGTTTCTSVDGLLHSGDDYVKELLGVIEGSPSFTANSAIFVVWDEDDYSSNFGCCESLPKLGGGHTVAIVVTKNPNPRYEARPHNHYSLLKTIEDGFGLKHVGHTQASDTGVDTMFDLL